MIDSCQLTDVTTPVTWRTAQSLLKVTRSSVVIRLFSTRCAWISSFYSAVLATAIPSVCPSVCLSVYHTPVLCENDCT